MYYDFASVVQHFDKDIKAGSSIWQKVDWKVWKDGQLKEDATLIEGWAVEKGKAKTVDPHVYMGDFEPAKDYKTIKMKFEFEAGAGTYDKRQAKDPYETINHPNLDKLKFDDPKKTKKYTLEFEVDQDGEYSYKDTGAGVSGLGKPTDGSEARVGFLGAEPLVSG